MIEEVAKKKVDEATKKKVADEASKAMKTHSKWGPMFYILKCDDIWAIPRLYDLLFILCE